jgi:hypothetical protein
METKFFKTFLFCTHLHYDDDDDMAKILFGIVLMAAQEECHNNTRSDEETCISSIMKWKYWYWLLK